MRFFKYFAHYVFNYRAYILLLFFKKIFIYIVLLNPMVNFQLLH